MYVAAKNSAVSFRFTFCTNLSSTNQEIRTKVTILQPSLPQVLQFQNLNWFPEHETAFLQCQTTSQSIFETKLSYIYWNFKMWGHNSTMPSKGHGASKQPWASDKQGKKYLKFCLDLLERSVDRKQYFYCVSACSIQCPSPNLDANFSTTAWV